jgi:hypothetical protein
MLSCGQAVAISWLIYPQQLYRNLLGTAFRSKQSGFTYNLCLHLQHAALRRLALLIVIASFHRC